MLANFSPEKMKFRIIQILIPLLFISVQVRAQMDSILSRVNYEMDFRFRAEQDWNSRKSDGTFRDDRTRLRYRFRTGITYKNGWYSMGFRIRTGDPKKQQDPQLTLGQGFEEFGTLPLGFEKIYFQGVNNNFKFWLGKNTYPFEKNNELFWSDNVFPEGIFIEQRINLKSSLIKNIDLKGGHFILSSNGGSIFKDTYHQGVQTSISFTNDRLKIFPSIYLFKNVPNIPDGGQSFTLDYTILHFGSKVTPTNNKQLHIEFDLYKNLQDYASNSNISEEIREEKSGYVFGLQYGDFNTSKNWMFKLSFASIQRFSVVDFMAQNDWARWDYSSNNSPDGRLSNFNGTEIVTGYSFSEKINLVAKYYYVEQLIPYGFSKETGQRVRLDLNVKL